MYGIELMLKLQQEWGCLETSSHTALVAVGGSTTSKHRGYGINLDFRDLLAFDPHQSHIAEHFH